MSTCCVVRLFIPQSIFPLLLIVHRLPSFQGDGTNGGTDLPRPRGVVGQRNNQMTDEDRVKLQVLKGMIILIPCLAL